MISRLRGLAVIIAAAHDRTVLRTQKTEKWQETLNPRFAHIQVVVRGSLPGGAVSKNISGQPSGAFAIGDLSANPFRMIIEVMSDLLPEDNDVIIAGKDVASE